MQIRKVIAELQECDRLEESAWEQLLQERAQSLIERARHPVVLECAECGLPFVFDDLDFSCYRVDGIYFPEKCPHCSSSQNYSK
ncbi:hypothetical protein MHH28_15975 [Paenibacillus sp. FSL K6-1217]|uniref:hypothetical protein n=1 Tax=Paenibacillus sp. FSL K6-1217 TaxID=2921466 RepID=UPI00325513B7